MAETGDQRWRVDSIRDTSMQTRLIPLSDLEDEGFDVADDSAASAAEASPAPATPPQPLPPSFFPTNTGRMRPIIVAQPTAAATTSSTVAVPSAAQPARSAHVNAPQTAPFSSVASRASSAAANTSDSLARTVRSDAANVTGSTGSAESASDQPPALTRTPRISYSLQYRALHPRD